MNNCPKCDTDQNYEVVKSATVHQDKLAAPELHAMICQCAIIQSKLSRDLDDQLQQSKVNEEYLVQDLKDSRKERNTMRHLIENLHDDCKTTAKWGRQAVEVVQSKKKGLEQENEVLRRNVADQELVIKNLGDALKQSVKEVADETRKKVEYHNVTKNLRNEKSRQAGLHHQKVRELKAEVLHWKTNHDNMTTRNAQLRGRNLDLDRFLTYLEV